MHVFAKFKNFNKIKVLPCQYKNMLKILFVSRIPWNVSNSENEVLLLSKGLGRWWEAFVLWEKLVTTKHTTEDKVDTKACLIGWWGTFRFRSLLPYSERKNRQKRQRPSPCPTYRPIAQDDCSASCGTCPAPEEGNLDCSQVATCPVALLCGEESPYSIEPWRRWESVSGQPPSGEGQERERWPPGSSSQASCALLFWRDHRGSSKTQISYPENPYLDGLWE